MSILEGFLAHSLGGSVRCLVLPVLGPKVQRDLGLLLGRSLEGECASWRSLFWSSSGGLVVGSLLLHFFLFLLATLEVPSCESSLWLLPLPGIVVVGAAWSGGLQCGSVGVCAASSVQVFSSPPRDLHVHVAESVSAGVDVIGGSASSFWGAGLQFAPIPWTKPLI